MTDRAGDILHPYRLKFYFLLDLLARVGEGDSVLCRCEGLRVLQHCGATFLRSSEPRAGRRELGEGTHALGLFCPERTEPLLCMVHWSGLIIGPHPEAKGL